MTQLRKTFGIIFVLAFAMLTGCGQNTQNTPLSIKEAEKEFIRICKEEFDYKIVTKAFPNTFWAYLPIEEGMFDYKASPKTPPGFSGFADNTKRYSVQFLESTFKENTFKIRYDIIPVTESSDYGYTSTYTEAYTKAQNNILNVAARIFFETDGDKEAEDNLKQTPEFLVVAIADIKRGIIAQSTFNLDDFKKYMAQALPYDEYSKRYVGETRGDQAVIGDRAGTNIKFYDVAWPTFLAEQIANRVRFKYQRSNFPPENVSPEAILESVYQSTNAYGFNDFKNVELLDLRTQKEFVFEKSVLEQFKKYPEGGVLFSLGDDDLPVFNLQFSSDE